MDWIEIKMEVRDREAVEGISNMLAEMGTGGVMIEDPQAIADYADSGLWDAHEFSEELLNRKDIYIKSYLPQDENLMNRIEQIIIELNEIEIRMDMGPTRVTYKPVQEEDWANAWKVYFKPERIGKKTVIKPSWEEYTAQEGDLIIEIDPGMAFGTGNHATTALCLQMLEDYVNTHSTSPVWILVEQQKDGIANGHTEHYVETDIPTEEDLTGRIVPVLLESTNGKICIGKVKDK